MMPQINKKKMSVSNKALIISVVAVVLYTIAAFVLQFYNGTEISSTLTEKWFSFFTVELLALCGIKVTKVIKEYKKDIYDDEENEEEYDEEEE